MTKNWPRLAHHGPKAPELISEGFLVPYKLLNSLCTRVGLGIPLVEKPQVRPWGIRVAPGRSTHPLSKVSHEARKEKEMHICASSKNLILINVL